MFKQKVVIITGGSSGLGKQLAERVLRRGAHLALIARDQAKLEAVRDELSANLPEGRHIGIYSCNISDPEGVEKTIRAIADEIGPPSILINCAGVLHEGPFEKQTFEIFHDTMNVDFFGALHCIRAVLPYFKQHGSGRIVNISSMAGLMGVFGYAAYCSAKHALNGLTHTLRSELTPMNITVQLACPGEFESPLVDKLNTYRSAENRVMVSTIPVLKISKVADSIVKGMEKGTYLIIPGMMARLIDCFARWSPALSRLVADLRLKKVRHLDKARRI